MCKEKESETDTSIEQQTIRVPTQRNAYIKRKAAGIGSSYNSFINTLLDLGLRAYEGEFSICLREK